MYSDFDYTLQYRKEIRPLINELMKKCEIYKMPMFVSVCTKSNAKDTNFETNSSEFTYENNMITGYHFQYSMPKGKDLIAKFANVVNGFSVIPPTDEMEVMYEEDYLVDKSMLEEDNNINSEMENMHNQASYNSNSDYNFEIEYEDSQKEDDNLFSSNNVLLEEISKRRGRPKGSKNKPKDYITSSESNNESNVLNEFSTSKRRGRPKGSKNKSKEDIILNELENKSNSIETQIDFIDVSQPTKKRGRPKGIKNKPKF